MGAFTRSLEGGFEEFDEFFFAIASSASSIIVVHNHPSGDPSPSEEDRGVTKRLADAGVLLGIPLLDHLIIGAGKFLSLKERGAL